MVRAIFEGQDDAIDAVGHANFQDNRSIFRRKPFDITNNRIAHKRFVDGDELRLVTLAVVAEDKVGHLLDLDERLFAAGVAGNVGEHRLHVRRADEVMPRANGRLVWILVERLALFPGLFDLVGEREIAVGVSSADVCENAVGVLDTEAGLFPLSARVHERPCTRELTQVQRRPCSARPLVAAEQHVVMDVTALYTEDVHDVRPLDVSRDVNERAFVKFRGTGVGAGGIDTHGSDAGDARLVKQRITVNEVGPLGVLIDRDGIVE